VRARVTGTVRPPSQRPTTGVAIVDRNTPAPALIENNNALAGVVGVGNGLTGVSAALAPSALCRGAAVSVTLCNPGRSPVQRAVYVTCPRTDRHLADFMITSLDATPVPAQPGGFVHDTGIGNAWAPTALLRGRHSRTGNHRDHR